MRRIFFWAVTLVIFFPWIAHAHQPVLTTTSPLRLGERFDATKAEEVQDPTAASVAIYGAILEPGDVDLYYFTSGSSQDVPVEALVPVRPSMERFRPWVAVIGAEIEGGEVVSPLQLPEGFGAVVSVMDSTTDREVFYEPFSVENLYHGNEIIVHVEEGRTYYLAVYDPTYHTGVYSLGAGTVENFTDADFGALLSRVFRLKMGLHAGVEVPWKDIMGLFLVMTGFVIGLGAVTVIDLHGFLGRKSTYWTEATTRTHKVTKPMIWAGLLIATIGALMLYQATGFSGTAPFHLVLLMLLLANGLFLTFRVSPYMLERERKGRQKELLPTSWQRKIAASLVVSVIGWWGSLFLFAWHIVMLR